MKILIILSLFFITQLTTAVSFLNAQDGLQYKMVSYSTSGSGNNNASTPFLNLAFFNKPYFTINYQSFESGFQFLFDLMIGISIATAVIVFMFAAFQEIIGGNNAGSIQKGKEGMQNAIIGLMIVLSTWLIINTINPDLVRLPIFSGLDQLKAVNGSSGGNTNVTSRGTDN